MDFQSTSSNMFPSEDACREALKLWGERIIGGATFVVAPNHYFHASLFTSLKEFHIPAKEEWSGELGAMTITAIAATAFVLLRLDTLFTDYGVPLGVFSKLDLAKAAVRDTFAHVLQPAPCEWSYAANYGIAGAWDTQIKVGNATIPLRIIPLVMDIQQK